MNEENSLEKEVVNGDDESVETVNVFELVQEERSGKEIMISHTEMKGCQPCECLKRALDELVEDYDRVIFVSFDPDENPEAQEFHLQLGLFAHPSVVITDGDYIFWKMGAGSVQEEKKFYSELFDAMLEGEIEMDREEGKVELMTEELGKLSFEGRVIA